jgi:hypothetical protein
MAPLTHYYGEEIRHWQLQNKCTITHYEVSELFGNALSGSANRKNCDKWPEPLEQEYF